MQKNQHKGTYDVEKYWLRKKKYKYKIVKTFHVLANQ